MAEDPSNLPKATPPQCEPPPLTATACDVGAPAFVPARNAKDSKHAGLTANAPRPKRASTGQFFILAAIALVILAGYNALIWFASQTTQRYRLLQTLQHLPPGTDCVFLGNSLMAAGGDPAAFKSAWRVPQRGGDTVATPLNDPPVPVNLALGATTPVEHYLILKHALAQPVHLKYLVYGFFDDQLNAPVSGNWTNLMGNRAFSYYFPEEAAAFYAPGSRWEMWKLWLIGHIPMFTDRSSFWGKVELLRRWCGQIGMPKQKSNRFGRAADFAELEPRDVASFTERCEAVVRGRKGFSPALRGIFQLAREHGIKVILVEMPMPPKHRQEFYSLPAWADLRAHLRSLAARENASYISASDWVTNNADFEDPLHMNQRGAQVFSRRLALAMSGEIAPVQMSYSGNHRTPLRQP